MAGTLELGASPSSKGLSSTEPEFALEMLSVRGRPGVKGEVWLGEPERPIVVRERRRRWAWAAASVMGPGKVDGGLALPAVAWERPKRSTNWPAKDDRRRPLATGGEGGEVLSADIFALSFVLFVPDGGG